MPKPPPLGAHMSIAGGCYRAVEAAAEAGCDCVQLFSKNNNQWRGKALSEDDCDRFRKKLAEFEIGMPLIHDSYLINLGSPDDELWRRSIDAFVDELERATRLGVPYVVAHPGSYTTADEEFGLARIAAGLDEVHRRHDADGAQCLLETTAGQGTNLGHRFEHLAAIIEQVAEPDRLGVCFDTCHVFAAGYPLAERKDYLATMRELDNVIGLERLKAFHLNDSKKPLGSRVDRHEHIGQGCLGVEPFRHLMNDRRFRQTPMYLETPKGENEDGENWDVVNLRVLRDLVK